MKIITIFIFILTGSIFGLLFGWHIWERKEFPWDNLLVLVINPEVLLFLALGGVVSEKSAISHIRFFYRTTIRFLGAVLGIGFGLLVFFLTLKLHQIIIMEKTLKTFEGVILGGLVGITSYFFLILGKKAFSRFSSKQTYYF
jgi:hypothetical protein